MRKFLIISFTSGQKYTGGLQCSKRNVESIKTLVGDGNVMHYIIEPYTNPYCFKTKFKRVSDIFYGAMGGLDKEKTNNILEIIGRNGITDLFIDSSLLGLLAKRVKKIYPEIRIVTFFHNFEKGFVKDYIRVNQDYFRLYWTVLTNKNERSAIKFSDKIITLNVRDAKAIEQCYGRKPDAIIPITLMDTGMSKYNEKSTNHEAIFIGSYFFGNVQGIKWFCKNVLPFTDIHLTIVGASMDKLRDEMKITEKISIYCDVPDLSIYFRKADFVVLPILSGSGMKVKTAESLMYGKYIIGTDEAFRGYEIDETIGRICNSAEDFISTINNLDIPFKFNQASRTLYEKKYSFDASLSKFAEVLAL